MNHESAVKAKRACITTLFIISVWAMGHLKVAKDSIAQNPETVGVAFLIAYALPVVILLILAIVYSIIAKKTEFDDLDD